MSVSSVPQLVVDVKTEMAVSLVGIFAACVATYHVGKTGNWEPLAATSFALALTVLFVTAER
jgi:phosphotransferase system  glucose/maltose/N-acetylglucosamine-specific IIC component